MCITTTADSFIVPPGERLQGGDLGAVPLQGYSEVGWCVLSFEGSKNTRVLDGIRVTSIDQL